MADRRDTVGGGPAIPDLDLPGPKSTPSTPNLRAPLPKPNVPAPAIHDDGGFGDAFGGMEIERGAMSSPPTSHSTSGKPGPAIDFSSGSDDFGDMEIQRGGAIMAPSATSSFGPGAPSTSQRPRTSVGPASQGPASQGPASGSGLGLDVAYRRMDRERPRPGRARASVGETVGAWVVTVLATAASVSALVHLVHRPPGRPFTALLPRAFDATSVVQSGAFALTALTLAIAIGYIGLKVRRRSYAMLGSAVMLLVASLAMVTVTLVATEESPTPADGALLIPYVMPLALFFLGFGISGRGPGLFLDGGARRATTILVALVGGALIFAALELSALSSLLPRF